MQKKEIVTKRQTGVRLPNDLIKQLKILAIDWDMSFSSVVEMALREWVAQGQSVAERALTEVEKERKHKAGV